MLMLWIAENFVKCSALNSWKSCIAWSADLIDVVVANFVGKASILCNSKYPQL